MLTTKSIRLTEEEAADLREYLEITGEVEAVALKRAAPVVSASCGWPKRSACTSRSATPDTAPARSGLPRDRSQLPHVLMETARYLTLLATAHDGTRSPTRLAALYC